MDLKARPWLVRGVIAAVALVAGLGAWLADREDNSERAIASIREGPQSVTAHELATVAVRKGHPIYWVGEMPGTALEANEVSGGGVQVRYASDNGGPPTGTAETGEGWTGAKDWTGTDEAKRTTDDVLTIGTYPIPDPAGAVDALVAEPGAIVRRSVDKRTVVASADRPTSVYFASPDNEVQVEIYDPSPARALSLALSLRTRPLG